MKTLAWVLLAGQFVILALLCKVLGAIGEWMEAMKELHDGHQHEAPFAASVLSGPVVGASDRKSVDGES